MVAFPGHMGGCTCIRVTCLGEFWWTWPGSNRRPLPCHGSALPAAPQAHFKKTTRTDDLPGKAGTRSQLRHRPTSEDKKPTPDKFGIEGRYRIHFRPH